MEVSYNKTPPLNYYFFIAIYFFINGLIKIFTKIIAGANNKSKDFFVYNTIIAIEKKNTVINVDCKIIKLLNFSLLIILYCSSTNPKTDGCISLLLLIK